MYRRKYKAGSIVKVKYWNFNNEKVNGLFCVIYDEAYDEHTPHNGNVLAVKVTTKLDSIANYSVYLNANGANSFFLEKSFAQCSKIHTFDKQNEIFGCIGRLDKNTTNKILNNVALLTKEVKEANERKSQKKF